MTKKTGLGRGLSSLLPENEARDRIRSLDMEKIRPRPNQPRKEFKEEELEALAQSIQDYGLIQPILVIRKGSLYEIVAGERRFRAAKKAGLASIPAIVKEMDQQETMEVSLIENIQREDLNPIEEALAYEELREAFHYTQEELSQKMGKSRSYIANTLRLLQLDDESKEALVEGRITSSQARTLLAVANPQARARLLEELLQDQLTVRDLERRTRQVQAGGPDPFVAEVEDQLVRFFGTRVQVREKKKGGSITIDYVSHDDLQRILELLGG